MEKYYSTGRMAVDYLEKGKASVQLYDFPEITRNYTRVVLYAIEATIIKAGGRTHRRDVTKDIQAGDATHSATSDCTAFSYTWSCEL